MQWHTPRIRALRENSLASSECNQNVDVEWHWLKVETTDASAASKDQIKSQSQYSSTVIVETTCRDLHCQESGRQRARRIGIWDSVLQHSSLWKKMVVARTQPASWALRSRPDTSPQSFFGLSPTGRSYQVSGPDKNPNIQWALMLMLAVQSSHLESWRMMRILHPPQLERLGFHFQNHHGKSCELTTMVYHPPQLEWCTTKAPLMLQHWRKDKENVHWCLGQAQ